MLVKRKIEIFMRPSILGFWKGDDSLKPMWFSFEGWFLFGIIPLILREVD